MANKKISELNNAVNLKNSDLLVVVNAGETRKTTLGDLNQAMLDTQSGSEGACHVATTANVDLATVALLTIDGLTLQDGYRVLVWKQTSAAENGIYIAHPGAWTRASDFSTSANVVTGSTIAVTYGNTYKKSIFQLTTVGTITVGTSPVALERISGWQFDEIKNSVSLSDKSVTIGTRQATLNGGPVTIGTNSFGQGSDVIASANFTFASGSGSKAIAANAHAEGSFTNANGANSHAEGAESNATGTNSHAEGSGTTASGTNSHAEGNLTTASNNNTHAEGDTTIAGGDTSHAQGKFTFARGDQSHTGGLGDSSKNIIASGIASFNHSFNSSGQVSGNGARGDHSAILGGTNNDIASGATDSDILGGYRNQILATALRSVILGGSGISAADADTAYAKIVRLLNYLTIDAGTLLSPVKNNTIENNGTSLYYTNGTGTREHLSTVENLRVSIPITFDDFHEEAGTTGRVTRFKINTGDVTDYFPIGTTGLEAVLTVDVLMNNSTAFGEVWLQNIDTGVNVPNSLIAVAARTTAYTVKKSIVFTISPNTTYGILLKRATASPLGKIIARSAQLILRPKF